MTTTTTLLLILMMMMWWCAWKAGHRRKLMIKGCSTNQRAPPSSRGPEVVRPVQQTRTESSKSTISWVKRLLTEDSRVSLKLSLHYQANKWLISRWKHNTRMGVGVGGAMLESQSSPALDKVPRVRNICKLCLYFSFFPFLFCSGGAFSGATGRTVTQICLVILDGYLGDKARLLPL